jgi:hypothetical protein
MIPLDRCPEHANALGRMMGHWAIVENCLSDLLGHLLKIEQSRQHLVFNTFVSLSSKIDLIQRLIHSYAVDCPEKTQLLKLIKQTIKCNSTRNSYVHAIWAASGSREALIKSDNRVPPNPKNRKRPLELVKASDINDFVKELSSLSTTLLIFRARDLPKILISDQPLQ